jgi:hypothetical protein
LFVRALFCLLFRLFLLPSFLRFLACHPYGCYQSIAPLLITSRIHLIT